MKNDKFECFLFLVLGLAFLIAWGKPKTERHFKLKYMKQRNEQIVESTKYFKSKKDTLIFDNKGQVHSLYIRKIKLVNQETPEWSDLMDIQSKWDWKKFRYIFSDGRTKYDVEQIEGHSVFCPLCGSHNIYIDPRINQKNNFCFTACHCKDCGISFRLIEY